MASVSKPAVSRIDKIDVTACTIPTDFPESDGTIEWDKTTIVIVEAKAGGASGIGYTYADVGTAKLIESLLRGVVEGRGPMDVPGSWMAMVQSVRNLGRPGIASMAISAVDIALWDLKAKLLRLPLVKLIGSVRSGIPVYGSGGFTSYSLRALQRQLADWVSFRHSHGENESGPATGRGSGARAQRSGGHRKGCRLIRRRKRRLQPQAGVTIRPRIPGDGGELVRGAGFVR